MQGEDPSKSMSVAKRRTLALPRLTFRSAGILMTPEEFDAVRDYDDRFRYELIRGVLVVGPIASVQEAGANELLGFLLRCYQEDHPEGRVLDATLPERYIITAESRRRADRVVWLGLGRCPDPAKDVPAIVVEFVSAGRRNWMCDYEEKKREYLELGVREYWIVNRFRRDMTVYRPAPDGVAERGVAEADIYRTELLPGFELPLARLLGAADHWSRK
jgi:Uma2 family endonuclease